MQTRRILKDINLTSKRQISFIMGALQGGSIEAVIASFGVDGPPEMTIINWWAHLDILFAPVESDFYRNNRFKAFKLDDFPSIALFLERYQSEMAKCSAPPREEYRLNVLTTAIQEIPHNYRVSDGEVDQGENSCSRKGEIFSRLISCWNSANVKR